MPSRSCSPFFGFDLLLERLLAGGDEIRSLTKFCPMMLRSREGKKSRDFFFANGRENDGGLLTRGRAFLEGSGWVRSLGC